MQRINVLLIEDDPDYAFLISLRLNEACGTAFSFALQSAETLADGLALLEKEAFDAVLLDLMLPDSRGLETIGKVRAKALDMPIIVMTSLNDEQTGLEAVARGAQDYIVKERFDAPFLRRVIGHALERHRSYQMLYTIIEGSPDGMAVLSEGIVRYANAAAGRLLARPPADLVGRPFPWKLPDRLIGELKLPGAGGEERTYEVRRNAIDWRGAPAFLAAIRDITELKRLEQIRAEIRERRRVEKFKDQIISTVSHELRSPLTVVKAAVSNIHEGLAGKIPEAAAHMILLAHRNLERLTRIVNNLLDISRLESGKIEARPRRFDLMDALREAAQAAALAPRASAVSVRVEASECKEAFADPDMVMQVLGNLLDNAVRYAKDRIVLSAKEWSEEGCPPQVLVWISDDGPGIPKEKARDLFQRFVQVDRPAGGAGYQGTGLGLSICREIVRINGGRIWMECLPGGGTVVSFTLPAKSPGPEAEVLHGKPERTEDSDRG